MAQKFDLTSILDGVKMTQRTVTLYLDASLVRQAYELNAEIENELNAPTGTARAITDDTPQEKLKALLDELEQNALKVTLRSLASSEVTVIRAAVVRENKIPKSVSNEERDELMGGRVQTAYEYLLAHSIIKVEHGGSSANGLTKEETAELRKKLPSSEWAKLTDAFDTVQSETQALEEVISDPSFRWNAADES